MGKVWFLQCSLPGFALVTFQFSRFESRLVDVVLFLSNPAVCSAILVGEKGEKLANLVTNDPNKSKLLHADIVCTDFAFPLK